MTIHVCVHGHAYQPPRESPETGEVPRQASAAPFHDWNERITSECYRPFGRAERHEPDGTTSHLNLWESVSFDLGPTLGVWMDRHATEVAGAIAEGDRRGLGAMAHPWVHAILPLTPAADRATIVRWGVDEFRARFGRRPTGMWLPETAVDTASLEAVADAGIEWTMLAPHQVRAGRGRRASAAGATPLAVALPSGRSMTVVPYDGELSHGVAFGGLLDDGAKLAAASIARGEAAAHYGTRDPLIVLSTDLETFGHHHKFGEMALAAALAEWQRAADVEIITPDRYLERYPATAPGELVERTSWSCAHGIERWRSDCGCRMDDVEGRDQRWRRPLRDVLDAMTDVCARLFNEHAPAVFTDPWAARHDYGVVLAARPLQQARVRGHFVGKHLRPGASDRDGWAWMEAERLRLEAWSSCAWFFDSPDRIETQQVLVEARAALERYAALTGADATGWFDGQLRASALI